MQLKLIKYVCLTRMLRIEFRGPYVETLTTPVDAEALVALEGKGVTARIKQRHNGDDLTSEFTARFLANVFSKRNRQRSLKGQEGLLAIPIFETPEGQRVTLQPFD